MRIDITEYNTKKNSIKVFVIVILAMVLIALFSTLGIYYAKLYKINYININKKNNNIAINTEFKNNEKVTHESLEEREQVKKVLLPKYSENAKKQMKNIYNEKTKIAYLTFDDGPSEVVTPLILDLLKQENIKATFFVVGSYVKRNPDIVKRAYLEGHYIANHGYTHNYSKIYTNSKSVLEEYNKTEKEIKNAIGNSEYKSYLFRFPGGYSGGKYKNIKKQAGKLLNENNISYIDWNVLTGDAQGATTKEKILNNIKKYTKDKGNIVVLMHDASSKILTYETLKDVIDYLRNEGYTFDNFYSIMN